MTISSSRVVYIGRRLLTGQKIAYWYRELDDSNTLGAAKGAFQPYQAGVPIGAILEIRQPGDDPTKILMNGPNAPRVVDSWPHPADIETWRLDDLADAQAAYAAQRAARHPRYLRTGPRHPRHPLRPLHRPPEGSHAPLRPSPHPQPPHARRTSVTTPPLRPPHRRPPRSDRRHHPGTTTTWTSRGIEVTVYGQRR